MMADNVALSPDAEFWEKTYHVRVHKLLLPLSVRQNRIEDIFADFLFELASLARGRRPAPAPGDGDRFEVLCRALEAGTGNVALPGDEARRDLVFRWLRSELVREERAANRRRTAAASYSLVPLHIAVAERFGRPTGNIPAYGAFLVEMLSVGRPAGQETALLRRLWEFFSRSAGDPLAAVLELAFARAPASGGEGTPWQLRAPQLVRCPEHARHFQRDVENVFRFEGVSRRTRLLWLYSLFAFHLASYFLRMARAAERCASALASAIAGCNATTFVPCGLCRLDPNAPSSTGVCANAPEIVLGERNLDHARLFKRYPYYTSQLPIARSYLKESESAALEKLDPVVALDRLLGRLAEEGARNPQQLTEWFELLAADYPTETDNRRRRGGGRSSEKWRLSQADKKRAVDLLGGGRASAFETVALHLNFEDMARASNNVMEWQFYQTLARDSSYGFARGRGEELRYMLPDGLLAALVHTHVAAAGEDATVHSFERALEGLGLRIDDAYRADLLRSLVDLGLVEDVADAGDAKRLSAAYRMEGT